MRRWLLFILVLLVAISSMLARAFVMDSHTEEFVVVESLDAPDAIDAGDIATINVRGRVDGVSELFVLGAYARLRFEVSIANGEGRLDLPAAVTQHAGVVTIESGGSSHDMEIYPGAVSTLVAPLVGPRTIVANGADQTLAVLLPTDRFGNQVADGTDTEVAWTQPDDVDGTRSIETADGMSWVLVSSGEVTGPTTIRASAHAGDGDGGSVRGAAVRIDEVPSIVTNIELSSAAAVGLADGRSVITLNTEPLTDGFDNTLADGTSAQFRFDGPSGQGVVTGTVQNGVVRIELAAPARPGRLTGYLDIQGVASNDITIDYSTAISGFDAYVETIGEEAVLRVSNALDPSSAFIADGTEVRWGDLRGTLRHGSAEIWIPAALADVDANVEILGLNITPEQVRP